MFTAAEPKREEELFESGDPRVMEKKEKSECKKKNKRRRRRGIHPGVVRKSVPPLTCVPVRVPNCSWWISEKQGPPTSSAFMAALRPQVEFLLMPWLRTAAGLLAGLLAMLLAPSLHLLRKLEGGSGLFSLSGDIWAADCDWVIVGDPTWSYMLAYHKQGETARLTLSGVKICH